MSADWAALDWRPLTARLRGAVLLGADQEALGLGKQLVAGGRPQPRPRAWIRCRHADDPRHALDFLLRHGLPFALRSAGHCFADHSWHANVVLDFEEMQDFALDADGLLRVQPGCSVGRLGPWLAKRGLSLPLGSCPSLSLTGLCLSGGYGLYGRAQGLLSDRLEGARGLLADGGELDLDPARHAELLWALRGAGAGQLLLLTQLKLRPLPAPPPGQALLQSWPLSAAERVLEAWLDLAPGADPALNLELQLIGASPEQGGEIRLSGLLLDRPDRGLLAPWERRLGPLPRLALDPLTQARVLCGELDRDGQPAWEPCRPYREQGWHFSHSQFFERPPAGLDRLLALLRDPSPAHRELEFVPWGGAYAAGPPSAFAHRGAALLLRHTAAVGGRASAALQCRAREWAAASRDAVAAQACGAYAGFADPELAQPLQAYYGASLPRLRALKAELDPLQRLRHAQSLIPG